LGDTIEAALSLVGVVSTPVAQWVGHTCGGCEKRKAKLNKLDAWARQVAADKAEDARRRLSEIMGTT